MTASSRRRSRYDDLCLAVYKASHDVIATGQALDFFDASLSHCRRKQQQTKIQIWHPASTTQPFLSGIVQKLKFKVHSGEYNNDQPSA
ncbi:hypothetical protein HBI56_106190 [Parastagonospora nodorum]|uniref:Uncharacterized protein n=1 Tax=Phaeosphaeria nodorum (strain SN15 / ATCC MYA-4574 / FGSC 10173) TaxID=321614 RepID=A0A7U2FCM7_PHANO|nr:hypothetical protein HBH56_132700 [Parastagonospora nodorum]QRD02789.1 hypothetical protein JI435_418670 [Parastagonospora nodorum SN15]KAH3927178.1 hypothetical protein HBH54_160530 [Parastagonospora nodorum]KAH3949203.1 hypothetical protein HBH53_087660 [Parastagonospora nodorum]KAH3974861.1 hypothetical protein HBH52_133840 [Parastagonospora nodorum]